ncbi:hypothetical protein LH452_12860 [Laribacter hongkongensis]|uniref:hypothetical protein n=1 Tax=Laribacter hongkongensis TaxID=168471 RepID=UPI001EFDFD62|nr:hypothetical protein [Laribacter hongkongensis]MCG9059797.1 hypothetical protein [Laribacter hongkongensis]MCG9084139.1 hypothetical protein [Laribacter hongkongensis]MCG9086537.1 hypothetical protein [Laribacter hongkongensis]
MPDMTPEQRSKCQVIIHAAALGAGAGNLSPVPGTGIAADMTAMTLMATALASIFGRDISNEMAKAMAIATLKQTVLRQPVKTLAKELAKLVPVLGSLLGGVVSMAMVEAAGWAMANEMAMEAYTNDK